MTKTDIKIIKANIQGQLNGDYIAPIVLSGAPGIGKTSTIQALANELQCGFVNVSAAGLTTEQLSG